MTSLPQEYLLLVLDDDAGVPLISGAFLKYGLAGAALVDLALHGRIEMTGSGGTFGSGVIHVKDRAPVGDAVLDTTLRELAADKPRRPQAIVHHLSRDIRPRVVDQLVDAGILRRDQGRVLGLFPRETWPAASKELELRLRRDVADVLAGTKEPDDRLAALVTLLAATFALAPSAPREKSKQLRARARQIEQRSWDSAAVGEVTVGVDAAILEMVATLDVT